MPGVSRAKMQKSLEYFGGAGARPAVSAGPSAASSNCGNRRDGFAAAAVMAYVRDVAAAAGGRVRAGSSLWREGE